MEKGLEGHGLRQIGGGDGQKQKKEGCDKEPVFQDRMGQVDKQLFQRFVVVKADDDAQKEERGAAGGQASDDRQIGCEPVGPADKQQGVDGNDGVGDTRQQHRFPPFGVR